MATAYYYSFSKKHNSTAQPTGGTSITVDLKGGCDLIAPVFVLSFAGTPTFNYISFEGRFYFVTGIKSIRNDLWEVSCSVDVLATWKSAIQAMNAYVLYYDHSQTEISDKRLSTKTTKVLSKNTASFDVLGNGSGTNYAVVLNVIGFDACDSYVTDQATARSILNNLDNWFDNSGAYTSNGSGIKDSSDAQFSWASVEDSIRSFFDEVRFFFRQWFATGKVPDNLRSANMFPLPPSAIGGFTDTIKLGQYDTGIQATRVYDRIFSDGCTISIPWQANDWRRNAPYHELYLYIPYIGLISLSPSDLIDCSSLGVSVSIDVTSGDAVFSVYTDTNRYIGQYCTNMASAFAIGTSNIPLTQKVNDIIAGTASAVAVLGSSGAIGGAGLSHAGVALANDIAGSASCIGTNMGGAVLGVTNQVVCYSIFHDTTVGPHTVSGVAGEPHNGVLALSGVSGFVQCKDASVSGAMTDTEREEINNLLNGGVFIE